MRRGVALAFLLVAISAAPGLFGLWGRWMLPDGYYGHGPLIPLVSAWLVWRDRARLAALAGTPSPWGLVLVGLSTWLLLLGLFERIPEAEAIAFVGALGGSTLVLFGARVFRASLFPLLYLIRH